jgi:hypothetical protein
MSLNCCTIIAAAAKKGGKNVMACAFLWKNHKPNSHLTFILLALYFSGVLRESSRKFVLSDFFAKFYLKPAKRTLGIFHELQYLNIAFTFKATLMVSSFSGATLSQVGNCVVASSRCALLFILHRVRYS